VQSIYDAINTVYPKYNDIILTDGRAVLLTNRDISSSYVYLERYDAILTADRTNDNDQQYNTSASPTYVRITGYIDDISYGKDKIIIASDAGLTYLYEDVETKTNGMVAHITDSYCTG
jgi:hypothetical protein